MTQPALKVSEDIRSKSAPHYQAASQIEMAKSAPDGASAHVIQSHGLVCAATAIALQSAEASRRYAAEKMHLISTDLAVKLNQAATDYVSTDQQQGDNLNGQMPPR